MGGARRGRRRAAWRERLYEIIFEADTPAGKAFDVCLLWAIVVSVTAVMLETVRDVVPFPRVPGYADF